MADSTLLTLSAVPIVVALLVCIWGILVMGGGIQRGPRKGHRIIPPTKKPSERARPQSPQPDLPPVMEFDARGEVHFNVERPLYEKVEQIVIRQDIGSHETQYKYVTLRLQTDGTVRWRPTIPEDFPTQETTPWNL